MNLWNGLPTFQIEDFRNNYVDFEPYSHFNIKVYYAYQYYQFKSDAGRALINNDPITLKLCKNAIASFDDENNPCILSKPVG
ncbi:MAG: hypothetical protein R3B93_20640 [Bacteroidia bacterium]